MKSTRYFIVFKIFYKENSDEEQWGDNDVGGDDDDDTTWKIRKAAVKVISAVIDSRPEMLKMLYEKCASPLIARFKEREESVRVDIIGCFEKLLVATGAYLEKRYNSSS